MSQKQLFDCAQALKSTGRCPDECHGNCNPANPPGRSTHERFNDGKAYKHWPAFRRLPPWARGIDVERSRVPEFCAEARKEGFTVTLTYPGVAAEAQHVNFRKDPKISLWKFRPLKAGSKGPRVSDVVRRLWQLRDPQTSKPYLDPKILPRGVMTPQVVAAVKAFQRDHHQKEDGEVGIHTIRAMRAMLRVQQAKAGPVKQ
jgi:hypothetical protein